MERANEILALRNVHGRLAAQRGIDLADERGGHVYDRHASQIGGRGEAGGVGQGPTPNGHECFAAVDSEAGKGAARLLDDPHSLGIFTAWQEDPLHVPAIRFESRRDSGPGNRPGLGLDQKDGPARLAPAQRGVHSSGRNAAAYLNAPDCRVSAQHRHGLRRLIAEPSLYGADDGLEVGRATDL
jgi:hypothetical protein